MKHNQVANRNLVSINFYILATAYCLVAYLVTYFIFACVFLVKIRENRKAKYVVVIWKIGSSRILLSLTDIVTCLLTISAENHSFAYGGCCSLYVRNQKPKDL